MSSSVTIYTTGKKKDAYPAYRTLSVFFNLRNRKFIVQWIGYTGETSSLSYETITK